MPSEIAARIEKLLADVATALVEQRVNIVSCETITSADREAKMRFEFELANGTHLDAVINRIKGIDSVYDAYRTIPGAAATR